MAASRFLFACFLLIVRSHVESDCIHDSIHFEPLLKSNVLYSKNINKRRRLSADEKKYMPIRIRPYWSLESSTDVSEIKIQTIKNMVSAAITYFEAFIKVIPVQSPLFYPRSCAVGTHVSYNGPTSPYYNCKAFEESTHCGAHSVESSHFGEDWKYNRDGSVDTSSYPSGTGLVADLVLYVTVSNLKCSSSNAIIAWTTHCVLDQNNRPIFGNINFCPSQSIGIDWKKEIMTTIHELTHLLGFSSKLYSHFIDETGEELGIDKVIGWDMNNQWIITPTVREVAQSYFNCTDIIGAPLENYGSDASSHWDERYLNGEYMTEYSNNKQSYVSALTLALLQDTGWYQIDYAKYAEPQFKWGYLRGCAFFHRQCFNVSDTNNGSSNYPEYFCNPNKIRNTTKCTADTQSIGFCLKSTEIPKEDEFKYFGNNAFYGYESSDYCPYVDSLRMSNNQSIFSFDCFDINGNDKDIISPTYVPWIYSKRSKCINTKIKLLEEDEPIGFASCFPIDCNGYDLISKQWNNMNILVGNETVRCARNDTLRMQTLIYDEHILSIQCPDIDTICINQKPFECLHGAWNDDLNECFCQAGYTGQFCESQLKIIVDEVEEYNGTNDYDQIPDTDLCAFMIDTDDKSEFSGSWTYKGYYPSNKTIFPFYTNGIYYLYFDAWYHLWNIGTIINEIYVEQSVLAVCDIGERPFDVTACSQLFYFCDPEHYVWTQDLRFILLSGSCTNESRLCSMCEDLNISQGTANSFYLNTPSPIPSISITNDNANGTSTDINDEVTKHYRALIIIAIVAVTAASSVCFSIYSYQRRSRKILEQQLNEQMVASEESTENQQASD